MANPIGEPTEYTKMPFSTEVGAVFLGRWQKEGGSRETEHSFNYFILVVDFLLAKEDLKLDTIYTHVT